jgi:hypothetical protein
VSPLISTIHGSPQHQLSFIPACSDFNSRSLVTTSNSGDPSTSRAHVFTVRRIFHSWTLVDGQLNYSLDITQLNPLTHQPTTSHHFIELNCPTKSESKSRLHYDWAVYRKEFLLASSPLRPTNRDFFLNFTLAVIVLMSHPLWRENLLFSCGYAWPFVKCKFRTYNMILKILIFTLHTTALSVLALQSRSCLTYVSCATTAAWSFERS